MSEAGWRWASASVQGTSHVVSGTECQDSHLCRELASGGGPILLAFVSDGAGSASRSSTGSRMICDLMREQAEQYFAEAGSICEINSRLIASWIERFRDEIIILAASEGIGDREFACTLLGAIVGSGMAALFQIGDGAIVYSLGDGAEYVLAFWPERGEYENTTYFATQAGFFAQLQFKLVEQQPVEIAMLSDGLQRLALDYRSKGPHQPFFRGLFPHLSSRQRGELTDTSLQLSKYLDSSKINDRTDDDKTLVLATASALESVAHA